MKRFLFLLLGAIAGVTSVLALPPARQHALDSVKVELAAASTPGDSMRIYYDVFDLVGRDEKRYIAQDLYDLAARQKNNAIQLDMLRHLTIKNLENDSLRFSYQKKAEMLSPSSDQRMTSLFINIVNTVQAVRYSKEPVNRDRLRQLIERARHEDGASVYTRLEVSMALCAFLEGKGRNGLLTKYLKEAETYINRLSYRLPMLDIYYMGQVAISYTTVGDYKKSVNIDKQLLVMLDSLQTNAVRAGREFRTYDYDRYSAYRRILFNYEVLTPQEVEYYYQKVQETALQNESLTLDFDYYKRPDIYYLLGVGRQQEAIPLLLEQLRKTDVHISPSIRLRLINNLITAAGQTGDMNALREAYEIYHALKEDNDLYDDQQEFLDLQFEYENNTLNLERSQLAAERIRNERETQMRVKRSDRAILLATLIVVIILIIVMIVMYRANRRIKKLSLRRDKDNVALMEERDTLRRIQNDLIRAGEKAKRADQQKEEFISNVSNEIQTPVNAIVEYSQLIVDCIDDDRHRYLDRFASVVKLNAELLSTLVGDVLDIASHDKGTFKIEKAPASVHDISTVAIDTIKDRIPKDVVVINEIADNHDVLIDTDAKRVAQVLMNLLSNSAKFTTEGSIVLSGSLSGDGATYTFAVTDTGIGIPEGKEEIIFERFQKLSKYTQGVGLGLPVGRMIATLLDGELKVDTSYQGRGARLIFTIPVK